MFYLCFRESIYRLLPQTTPENVSKNFSQYSVDPTTRYPNISLNFLKPSQVSMSDINFFYNNHNIGIIGFLVGSYEVHKYLSYHT